MSELNSKAPTMQGGIPQANQDIIDVERLRSDTPCETVYLNHVSTSIPPSQVVEAVNYYFKTAVKYGSTSAHAQRIHKERFLCNRKDIADFIGAKQEDIVFTSSGSQAITMVASGLDVEAGDNILIDEMSFISNVAPFLMLKERYNIELRFIPAVLPGFIDLKRLKTLIDSRTKLITICHMANNLGVLQPAAEIGEIAKNAGIMYLLDAANTVGMLPIDVNQIGCDFMAVSGRKYLRGPSGSAFLYAKKQSADRLKPINAAWNSGTWHWDADNWNFHNSSFLPNPGIERLNTGETNFPAVFGLGRAITYANEIGGIRKIALHIKRLTQYMLLKMRNLENVTTYGPLEVEQRGGMVCFNVKGVSHTVMAKYLNDNNVAVMGHNFFCPGVLKLFGIEGVVRFCVHCFNTVKEIDFAISLLEPDKTKMLTKI